MIFKRKILLLSILILALFISGKSQIIQVKLFNQFKIKTLVVMPIEGKYQILTPQGKVDKLKKNTIIYFTQVGDSISLWNADELVGIYSEINFIGLSKTNIFKIEPVYPTLNARFYEGDITLSAKGGALHINNLVSIDNYLAGVVEAEAGPNAPFEFHKAQAIISRTYLYEIINRSGINYKIGDDVNFQVYKGMCKKNTNIRTAVIHTRGLVIIDSTRQLIMAAFHSNSGGSTANSEQVWLSSKNYLKQTNDPFSLNQRNSKWKDSVKTSEWLTYFKSKGFNINDSTILDSLVHFNQNVRLKYLQIKNDSIAFRSIRKDFKLRSTWFSVKQANNYIIISGKGYGHGVGLSQEGGMQMARQNYSFLDIIYFYYKNVKVVHINSIG